MKPIDFHCPSCGQRFEAGPQTAGQAVLCPTCNKPFIAPRPKSNWDKWAMLIVVVGGLGAIWAVKLVRDKKEWQEHQAFLREINPEKFEDAYETHRRWEKEADAVILRECSNYVGFSRILDHYVFASEDAITNWHGNATIDYINKQGGVERTNLLFHFFVYQHRCIGGIDDMAMMDRDFKRESAAAQK
jgi:hypothetical protein